MKNKVSFSNKIIKSINIIIALAFFVIFVGGGILLFVTEDDRNIFYIKIASTFVAYISLYLLSVILISRNIRKQFAPLDKLAKGLKDNSIDIIGDNDDIKAFAKQLKLDIEKIDNLSRELNETRSNLDDVYMTNEKTINTSIDYIDECKKQILKSNKRQKRIKENLITVSNSIEEIMPVASDIKTKQKAFTISANAIVENINYNVNNQKEIKEDYNKTGEAFRVLDNKLKESIGFIDSLFSEISVMQNIATQVNLFAMNTSIEAARIGIFNNNILNALDELKELSNKIQAKSDDVALLSIQSKNLLNLAADQSAFCKEQNDDSINMIDKTSNQLVSLSEDIKNALYNADEIIEDSNKLLRNIELIDGVNSSLLLDIDYTLDKSDNLGNTLFELDKSLKCTE